MARLKRHSSDKSPKKFHVKQKDEKMKEVIYEWQRKKVLMQINLSFSQINEQPVKAPAGVGYGERLASF